MLSFFGQEKLGRKINVNFFFFTAYLVTAQHIPFRVRRLLGRGLVSDTYFSFFGEKGIVEFFLFLLRVLIQLIIRDCLPDEKQKQKQKTKK